MAWWCRGSSQHLCTHQSKFKTCRCLNFIIFSLSSISFIENNYVWKKTVLYYVAIIILVVNVFTATSSAVILPCHPVRWPLYSYHSKLAYTKKYFRANTIDKNFWIDQLSTLTNDIQQLNVASRYQQIQFRHVSNNLYPEVTIALSRELLPATPKPLTASTAIIKRVIHFNFGIMVYWTL